jgi:hypothetical protein
VPSSRLLPPQQRPLGLLAPPLPLLLLPPLPSPATRSRSHSSLLPRLPPARALPPLASQMTSRLRPPSPAAAPPLARVLAAQARPLLASLVTSPLRPRLASLATSPLRPRLASLATSLLRRAPRPQAPLLLVAARALPLARPQLAQVVPHPHLPSR